MEGDLSEDLVEAVDNSEKCMGMFVKRGSLRKLGRKHELPFSFSSHHGSTKAVEASPISPTLSSSNTKYSAVQAALRSLLGLDKMEAGLQAGMMNMESRIGNMESRLGNMESRLGNIEEAVAYVAKNGLVKEDLHELAVVIDARRGISLPGNAIAKIIESNAAVSIAEVKRS